MEWLEVAVDSLYSQPSWYVGSAITSCYILYYLFEVVKKPLVVTSPKGRFHEFLDKHMPVLREKFWPTIWCIDPMAQTIIATIIRVSLNREITYKRNILGLKDGGEICLDTLEPKEVSLLNPPTIIVLPGLTGSSQSDYVTGLVLTASDLGMRVVVFNQRGIGIQIKTPRFYCASNSEDLIEVINYVKTKHKGSLIGAVGISLGGLILGNYLSTVGRAKCPLACAMVISVPWNAHLSISSLERPVLNILLNMHLVSRLTGTVRKVQYMFEGEEYNVDSIVKSKTMREFDSHFTAKHFGYKDANDYYNHASLDDKIQRFTIPVLCLNAADDPFQPIVGIPINIANKMDNVCIIVTSRGGHVAFMEGILPLNKEQYMFRVFGQYFKSMLLEGGVNYFSK